MSVKMKTASFLLLAATHGTTMIAAQQADGGAYFFDLSKDPLETENLFDTTDSKYIISRDKLISKLSHWSLKVVPPDTPDENKKKSTWKKAGGIVPWIEDNSTREIPSLYSSTGAPNIIFILVDDWGWNDVGYQSTYLNFTTPTIDRMAREGVKLTNYWTSPLCTPSRGALMTGKYAFRLGLSEERSGGELPLTEATLAEELKSAGYRTNMVGKWHLGMSSKSRTPNNRGFDYFYGYYSGFVDYWTKEYSGYMDLQNNGQLETDPDAISSSYHNAYLMTQKAVEVIETHASTYYTQPLFLYYASQLIHEDWAAPQSFIDRCMFGGVTADEAIYCGMNLMLDEVVSNITCALAMNGMADNTLIILASDNGGVSSMPGNSYPFKGSKGSYFRGGLSAAAFMHGSPISHDLRGTSYDGEFHVTDWLPTIMGLATNHKWEGSMLGESLDGEDMWYAVTSGGDSPHNEIIHYMDEHQNCSIQVNMFKLDMNTFATNTYQFPQTFFVEDQKPELKVQMCAIPSLTGYLDFLVLQAAAAAATTTLKGGSVGGSVGGSGGISGGSSGGGGGGAMKAGKPTKYKTPEEAADALEAVKPFKDQREQAKKLPPKTIPLSPSSATGASSASSAGAAGTGAGTGSINLEEEEHYGGSSSRGFFHMAAMLTFVAIVAAAGGVLYGFAVFHRRQVNDLAGYTSLRQNDHDLAGVGDGASSGGTLSSASASSGGLSNTANATGAGAGGYGSHQSRSF